MNQIDTHLLLPEAANPELGFFPSLRSTGQSPFHTQIGTADNALLLTVWWQETSLLRATLKLEDGQPALSFDTAATLAANDVAPLLAACETALALHPCATSLLLSVAPVWHAELLVRGAQVIADGRLRLSVELFWQQPGLWLQRSGSQAFPLQYTMTNGHRHPLRAPKPVGQVYARHIPWLGKTLSFRVADVERDLPLFNRWMNDPRVAYFWQEEGDLNKHRAYLAQLLADPHMIPLIACADGQPFGYFEVYWAKENRIGPYYDVDDFDRGWHVLIGEESVRGRAWVTAWLPSLMHYLFLDDVRTQRIVGEPRADHVQQINNLDRNGFAKIKEFDFPHKRAMLVSLLRERFFGERRLVPPGVPAEQLSLSSRPHAVTH